MCRGSACDAVLARAATSRIGLDADTFKPTKENTQRCIHREDLSFVEATLKKAVREKSEFELEYRIIRPNGSIRYHQSIGRPLGDKAFLARLERATKRTLRPGKRGPKPRLRENERQGRLI